MALLTQTISALFFESISGKHGLHFLVGVFPLCRALRLSPDGVETEPRAGDGDLLGLAPLLVLRLGAGEAVRLLAVLVFLAFAGEGATSLAGMDGSI